jgi:predicted nucleotidyltransferase
MSVETISALEKAIKDENILSKHHLERIGVFGSFARGEEANDIDFYIDSEYYKIEELISLRNDIEKITEKKADIMLKKYANPIIMYRAEKDMKYVTQY